MGPKLKNLKKISQKEERSAKYINQRKKDSYLADDNNFEKFSKQLSKIGLELRDITGDGNCLFRALSDQLEGNEGNHLLYRKQVCEFMRKNRLDFEPFVVGLVEEIEHRKRGGCFEKIDKNLDPFERYVSYLEQSSTYGGNDCLVAFSRLQEVDIFLHQIDQPCWKVNGAFLNSKNIKQIHLAYHNGEHYSSVRKIGDLDNTPANIHINTVDNNGINNHQNKTNNNNSKKNNYTQGASYYEYNDDYFVDETDEIINQIDALDIKSTNSKDDKVNNMNNFDEVLDNIMNVTNCFDINLIKEVYNENNYNVDNTIQYLLNILNTGHENENEISCNNEENDNKNNRKFKNSNLKPREKKQLKKQKQMERQRLKVLEVRENERNQNSKVSNEKENTSNENSKNNMNELENENVFNIPSIIEAKSI